MAGAIQDPSDQFLKRLLPALLTCCRDKNTAVRAAGEEALISLLSLTTNDSELKVSMLIVVADLETRKKKAGTQLICVTKNVCAAPKNETRKMNYFTCYINRFACIADGSREPALAWCALVWVAVA